MMKLGEGDHGEKILEKSVSSEFLVRKLQYDFLQPQDIQSTSHVVSYSIPKVNPASNYLQQSDTNFSSTLQSPNNNILETIH